MNAISFTHRKKRIDCTAPSVWNEVTPRQLMLWVFNAYRETSDEEKLELAVPIFYGIKPSIFKDMKPWQRIQIAPSLRMLIKENRLNRWVIKSFSLFFKRYHGPADKLANLTAHEFFNVCEPLYWQFKQTGDNDTLNALCAVLYRPKRSGIIDDDIREDVTDAGIAKRQQKFKRLSKAFKLAIAFNYEGCRNYVASTHSKAFEGNKGKSKKRGDVTLSLAGGPLGDHASTKKTNLYTFLLHLVNLIEQEEEFKRNNP
ncbi:hypothetical protein SAMN05192574_101390 [Mucilaginibacter gossypiicola]|uniref:Uncharacterized protein n=1 Tax=Mucilaginibacter gossypiicola TaxID=551995 RepID=A0A1H8A988_9SPHI|nr:hypothetical protein [Mucilaginibacter gossypiicola]SEM66474.1 hypothetical protein SAMN05192574_101390 [Mucilaginibacter gossypiicola]